MRTSFIQPKLAMSRPHDTNEVEADRIAGEVMRMPSPTVRRQCACGGGCGECKSKDSQEGHQHSQTLPAAARPFNENRAPAQVDNVVSSAGHALDADASAFFEPRFGRDFSGVRVHSDAEAARSAQALGARAYTLGSHVVLGSGEYAPGTESGNRLLAHELTHVVQQPHGTALSPKATDENTSPPLPVHSTLSQETIAGDWIVDNPSHRHRPGGQTDAEILGVAFSQMCSLASESGGRISIGQGPPLPGQAEGCDCLWDIDNDLISPAPVLSATPHIGIQEHGWSNTMVNPAIVSVRHPESEFEWGYWTAGQTRHVKPFFMTVAHEVCGHVGSFVRSHGTQTGARGVGTGHNVAIAGENLIAAEHGVPASELRGLDFDPATGRPLAGHRGESFLQANIGGFAHGSDTAPASATAVVNEVIASINSVSSTAGLDLFVQVEGRAYGNEGGAGLANRRAATIRTQIVAAIRTARISLTVSGGASRFMPDVARVIPGTSRAGQADPNREVRVYLFHTAHSAGP